MDFSGEKKMDSWENMMTLMNREVSSLFEWIIIIIVRKRHDYPSYQCCKLKPQKGSLFSFKLLNSQSADSCGHFWILGLHGRPWRLRFNSSCSCQTPSQTPKLGQVEPS
jgi:hypothetical protein